MNNIHPLPFSESYWVVPGSLLAGESPGTNGTENTRKRIISLLRCGVTSVIDLTQPGDSNAPYESILTDEADTYGLEVVRRNYPIQDFAAPSASLMEQVLDMIDSEVANGKIVYVHCIAGIGRTGTVVGCYLVRHGYTGEEALEQINILRRGTSTWWHRSPESQDQVNFILNWLNGKKPDEQ